MNSFEQSATTTTKEAFHSGNDKQRTNTSSLMVSLERNEAALDLCEQKGYKMRV